MLPGTFSWKSNASYDWANPYQQLALTDDFWNVGEAETQWVSQAQHADPLFKADLSKALDASFTGKLVPRGCVVTLSNDWSEPTMTGKLRDLRAAKAEGVRVIKLLQVRSRI